MVLTLRWQMSKLTANEVSHGHGGTGIATNIGMLLDAHHGMFPLINPCSKHITSRRQQLRAIFVFLFPQLRNLLVSSSRGRGSARRLNPSIQPRPGDGSGSSRVYSKRTRNQVFCNIFFFLIYFDLNQFNSILSPGTECRRAGEKWIPLSTNLESKRATHAVRCHSQGHEGKFLRAKASFARPGLKKG